MNVSKKGYFLEYILFNKTKSIRVYQKVTHLTKTVNLYVISFTILLFLRMFVNNRFISVHSQFFYVCYFT